MRLRWSRLPTAIFLLTLTIGLIDCQRSGSITVCGESRDRKCLCPKAGVIDCENQQLNSARLTLDSPDFKPVEMLLGRNQIRRLGPEDLLGEKGQTVTKLLLDRNLIADIQDEAFDALVAVETLDLANNKLTSLSPRVFQNTVNLIDLRLDHNLLTDLSEPLFAKLVNLRYLSIDYTPVKTLSNESFVGLRSLIDLSIDHAGLSSLDEETFHPLTKLKTLSLRHNSFYVLPVDALAFLTQLERVDFSGNPLVTIDSNSFRYNPNLRFISFYNMPGLLSVEDCAFCNVHDLQELVFSNCSKLNYFDPEAFASPQYYTMLSTVDFTGCALTTLDRNMLPWNNISVVRLANNPWQCDCAMRWTLKLKERLELPDEVVCDQPELLRGKILSRLTDGQLPCEQTTRVRTTRLFLVIVGLLMSAVAVTTCWYLASKSGGTAGGPRLRNLFYKPQVPKYAYRNLAMGADESEEPTVNVNDRAPVVVQSSTANERPAPMTNGKSRKGKQELVVSLNEDDF